MTHQSRNEAAVRQTCTASLAIRRLRQNANHTDDSPPKTRLARWWGSQINVRSRAARMAPRRPLLGRSSPEQAKHGLIKVRSSSDTPTTRRPMPLIARNSVVPRVRRTLPSVSWLPRCVAVRLAVTSPAPHFAPLAATPLRASWRFPAYGVVHAAQRHG